MFSRERKTKESVVENIICEKYNSYYRLAYSYVHNEADAADIVQEGAYRAIKNCVSLKNPEFASTWIYKIMLNEIYRFLEGVKHISIDSEEYEEPEFNDVYHDIDLLRALDSMPLKDKAVIEMKYFEELKLDEIADILDENVSTVKSRLYRALGRLRMDLGELYREGA